MDASYLTRGILVGGSIGAFSNIFGFTESMFFSVGIGMFMGCLAGLTSALLKNRQNRNK